MGRPSDARSRFIASAIKLFRRDGFHGVGLNAVIEASQAPKGSFYHHFPGGKAELGEEAIRAAGRETARMIDQAFADKATLREAVNRFIGRVVEHFERSGRRDGCPVAGTAAHALPQTHRLAVAARDVLNDWQQRVVAHVVNLGVPHREAETIAERLIMTLQGAWLVARMRQSAEPFETVATIALGDRA